MRQRLILIKKTGYPEFPGAGFLGKP